MKIIIDEGEPTECTVVEISYRVGNREIIVALNENGMSIDNVLHDGIELGKSWDIKELMELIEVPR